MTSSGGDHLFLILQELPSIVPRFGYWCRTNIALEGATSVGDPGRGGAGCAELGLGQLLTAATLLLFDVYSAELIVVLEEGADCVVLHIALLTDLQRLQIVRKIIVYDVDASLQIDKFVVCVRFSVHYWLSFFDGRCGLVLTCGWLGRFYACYLFAVFSCSLESVLCH